MASGKIRAFIGSVLPILLIGSLHTDTSLAADRPDFSGTWQLDEELSEGPRTRKAGQRGGGRGMEGRSGGEGGRGGQRGGGDGVMRERLQSMKERIQTLEILHQDPELAIGFKDGSSRTLYTDGREMTDDLEAGTFDGEGKWKNQTQIVFKSENAMGGKITELYELDEAGATLFVTTTMESDGRRPEINFRRVYVKALAAPTLEAQAEAGS